MDNQVAMAGLGFIMFMFIVGLAITILVIASQWRIFTKAGQPGWASIIPIYNAFVLSEVAGKPIWWGILFLIPIVNIVVWFIVCISLAERFGKDTLFGLGLAIFSVIFFPILAFSDATYQ